MHARVERMRATRRRDRRRDRRRRRSTFAVAFAFAPRARPPNARRRRAARDRMSNGAIETRRGKQRTRGVDADETRRREDARGADARADDGAITRSREKIMCV
jgi:hypothetical protein